MAADGTNTLKAEVRALTARNEALTALSGGVSLSYLRAVVLQLGHFCAAPGAERERRNLLDVLATMLDFDDTERKRACVPPAPKRGSGNP